MGEKENLLHQENCIVVQMLHQEAYLNALLNTHHFVEVDLVIRGTGVHQIGSRIIPCKEGDVCVLAPHTAHRYEAESRNSNLTIRRIVMNPKIFLRDEYIAEDHPQFCHGVFCEGSTASFAALNKKTLEEIKALFDRIEKETKEQQTDWQTAVGAYLTVLLIMISRYMNGAIRNFSAGSQRERELVLSVQQIVNERFASDTLTLDAISSSLYVSSSLLSRSFKRCVGKSFSDYLRETRMEHACRLLRETDMTTDQILLSCGLKDIPSFYRSFHQYAGMTPNHYRNQYSKQQSTGVKGEKYMFMLSEISENLQKGKAKIVKEMVQRAIDEGMEPAAILNDGLLSGMNVIGEKFKNNEIYVPEVLVAARAMNMGLAVLKPHLVLSGVQAIGKVCIGTVQGDLHDIGKNLVKMMLEGKGFEVIDLGVDVPAETFVTTAKEQGCQIICCSALLTTTMDVMADVVKHAEAAGIRDQVKIMVGGAPVNQDFCDAIGADCYTADAASAADAAEMYCKMN